MSSILFVIVGVFQLRLPMNIDPQTAAICAATIVGPVVSVILAGWMGNRAEIRQRKMIEGFAKQMELDRRNYESGIENDRQAYEQKAEHRRIKIELFDKRFAVFVATETFINQVIGMNKEKGKEFSKILGTFAIDAKTAIFLFDEPLCKYLDGLWQRGNRIATAHQLLNEHSTSEDINEQCRQDIKLQETFIGEHIELAGKFFPFLKI